MESNIYVCMAQGHSKIWVGCRMIIGSFSIVKPPCKHHFGTRTRHGQARDSVNRGIAFASVRLMLYCHLGTVRCLERSVWTVPRHPAKIGTSVH